MSENLPIIIIAALVLVALLWWLLSRGGSKTDVRPPEQLKQADPQPTIEPGAPKSVAELAREMPSATTPVPLKDGVPAKPKAKAAAPKAKAAPAPKPKPKVAPAPKAKAAPAKAKAASPPKAKPATPKAKVAAPKAAPKPKVEAPKVKVAPAPKPKTAPAAKPKTTPAAKPKTAAAPKPAPKPIIPDNLELLKGVGPKVTALLKDMGVTSFEQVANWTSADVAEIDSKLGVFAGRISRDNWVDQAKLLSAGDVAAFEKKYGALGSEIR